MKSTYGAPPAPLAVLATARTCGGVVWWWRCGPRDATQGPARLLRQRAKPDRGVRGASSRGDTSRHKALRSRAPFFFLRACCW